VDITLALKDVARAPKGVRFVSSGLRRLAGWRAFPDTLVATPSSLHPKLLSHSGHGSVSLLIADKPLGHSASPHLARMTIRRINGAPSLADLPDDLRPPHCPQCGLPASSSKSLERHVTRCRNGGTHHLVHHGLAKTLRVIVGEVGVPKASIVKEARGLRFGDASRP
jgi:hypothetical protein